MVKEPYVSTIYITVIGKEPSQILGGVNPSLDT